MVETAPKAQAAPAVENQPEGKAAPAPKVLDFSTSKNKAPGKEETAPEKKPAKEQAEEKPKRGRPAKTDKAPAEKPKQPRDKMSQSKKAPGKDAPAPKKPEAAPKEAKAPEQEQPAAPRDATRSAEPEQIVYINLSELHPFKNHPFGVRDDSEMKGLVESVKASGVNQPALVRPREDGGYEIIAGHRRQKASELAGFANMPCIVRNMTDDEAILAMTDDNLRHREKILPTEKANSLKMQVEAIKHQGGPGLGEDAGKRSTEIVGERNGMNYKQVQRYEDDFLKAMLGRSAKVAENDRVRKQRELDGLVARDKELDALFERLYEDNVSGKIDDARFAKMSKRYEQEQGEISAKVKALRLELKKTEGQRMDVEEFWETVRRYTNATTITQRMVAELIDHIDVYHAEKQDGITTQQVVIYYNCVGAFAVPDRRKIPEADIIMETRKGVALSYAPAQIAV